MTVSRRTAIGGGVAIAGLAALPFVIDGKLQQLLPGVARRQGAPVAAFNDHEIRTLEAFGDILLPGAAQAGIAHFVGHHVAVPSADSLLMVRYMDVPPPYAAFYKAGLAALDAHSLATAGKPFADLPAAKANELVRAISAASPPEWQGPPSPLFYFVVRSDAVDVVYGTEEGFEKLGVPYMAHILPERKW